MQRPRLLAVVVVTATVLAFSGLWHGILGHGDEARFVVAAREVLRGGPWLIPTALGQPMVIKPPLFIWLVALAGKAHGRLDEFAARWPGALAAVATAVAVYLLGARLFGRQVALLAALLFSTTLGGFQLAREVLPDMPMTAASTMAMLGAVAAAQDGTRRAAVGFAVALALGFHFKLLVGLVPPLATVILVAAFRRDLQSIRALRPVLGAAVFFALLLPWLVRILLVPDFLAQIDSETFSGRAWGSWRKAYESPVRTLQLFVETLFPWSLLVPAAVVHAWRRRSELRDNPLLIPLVWLAVVVILNMAVNTVRWRYLLPALPPAALVIAPTWQAQIERGRGGLERWLSLGPLAGMLALFTLMGAFTLARVDPTWLVGGELRQALRKLPWMLVPVVWIAGGAAGLSLLGRRPRWAMLLCVSLVSLSLATIEPLTRAQRDRALDPRPFAEQVRAVAAGRRILSNSDSVRFYFYLDAPTTLLRDIDLPGALARSTRELVVLRADTLDALQRRGAAPRTVTVLAEGRFGDDHLVLVQGGGE